MANASVGGASDGVGDGTSGSDRAGAGFAGIVRSVARGDDGVAGGAADPASGPVWGDAAGRTTAPTGPAAPSAVGAAHPVVAAAAARTAATSRVVGAR